MTREIKFRGRRTDNGEWVYGSLCKVYNGCPIAMISTFETDCSGEIYDINAYTIGQYTGLKDRNGKEIYEGDTVQAHSKYKFVVVWIGTTFMLKGINYYEGIENIGNFLPQDIEVIGNKHERKEQ